MRSWMMAALLVPGIALAAPALPDPEDVLALDPHMQEFLQERVLSKANSPAARQRLLMEAVFGTDGVGMRYDGGTTRSVVETFHSGKGNCLSFTLMYVAMARALGLDVQYQEVDQGIWQRQGDTILRTSHINVQLRLEGRTQIIDFELESHFARASTSRVDESRALAHYYNNRGIELLLAGESDVGMAWVERATGVDPGFVPAWANLGVALRQAGREAEAEQIYLRALALAPSHAQTLSNLVGLYERWKDEPRKAGYVLRLREVRRDDPYHEFEQGLKQERSGDYALAARHFRRAVRLHEAEELFHLALFRVYYLADNADRAARHLVRANQLARQGPGSPYEAKFAMLGLMPQPDRNAIGSDRGSTRIDAPPHRLPLSRTY